MIRRLSPRRGRVDALPRPEPVAAPIADSILRLPSVLARVGLSRPTIYKLIQARRFPAPLRLAPNAVGWRASDIDRWIAGQFNPTEQARAGR